MSNKYDDYGYEDGSSNNNSGVVKKRILIGVFIVAAILIVIFLLRSCNSNNNNNDGDTTPTFNYESNLLEAGKKYYENNATMLPTAKGQCESVDLASLIAIGLVDPTNYATCNQNTTYVNVCMLESGKLQYTPWLTCEDKKSDTEYDQYKDGTEADLVTDVSLVKFMFLPQKLKEGVTTSGKTETYWKDEIPYTNYKTLATIKNYSYRDQLFTWNIENRTYYTSTGEQTDVNKVKEYYTVSPNSNYNLHNSKTTEAYKWFTTTSTKEYAMSNGSKAFSPTAIGDYKYNEGGVKVTRYQSRKVTGTVNPTKYYVCAKSSNSTSWVYQLDACGSANSSNPSLTYTKQIIYTCTAETNPTKDDIENNAVSSTSTCKTYSDWTPSGGTTTSCGNNSDVCRSVTVTFYNWYKLVDSGKRTYYPSGSATASSEKVYYIAAPVKGAIKDETTKTTAYKWYKATTAVSDYVAESPQDGATKTGASKWTNWTNWSVKNPATKSSINRQIKTRYQIKLQQITGVTEDSWENLSTEYVTEEEMINIFKNSKFNVESLTDINNNGSIRYQVKLQIRNKLEVVK